MPNLGINDKNIVLGAGDVLYARRGVVAPLVAAMATGANAIAPTVSAFTIAAAEADKLRPGDVLQLASVVTPLYTALEASTLPRVLTMTPNGPNFDVQVFPAFSGVPPTTAGGIRVLYKHLGATDGGIRIEATVSRNKQYVDQSPFPISAPVDKIEAMIIAPLAEALLSHFALALGVVPGTDETSMQMGANPNTDREDRILTVTPAPNGKNRFTVAHKCVSEGKASFAASKTDKSIIELQLGMMPDVAYGAHAVFDMKCA